MGYRRRQNKTYSVPLSNGKTLRIVAPSPQRALHRATKWCEKLQDVHPTNVHEVH